MSFLSSALLPHAMSTRVWLAQSAPPSVSVVQNTSMFFKRWYLEPGRIKQIQVQLKAICPKLFLTLVSETSLIIAIGGRSSKYLSLFSRLQFLHFNTFSCSLYLNKSPLLNISMSLKLVWSLTEENFL